MRGGDAGVRGAGDGDGREELARQGRLQRESRDAIKIAFEADGFAAQQTLDDRGVFDQPVVSAIVRSGIVEGDEIVLESTGDHVQAQTPSVQVSESADHLGHRVRMHVDGLHGDQRRERGGVLDYDLGNQPGIEKSVIGVDEHALAAGAVAPTRDIANVLQVSGGVGAAEGRTRGVKVERGGRGRRCPVAVRRGSHGRTERESTPRQRDGRARSSCPAPG